MQTSKPKWTVTERERVTRQGFESFAPGREHRDDGEAVLARVGGDLIVRRRTELARESERGEQVGVRNDGVFLLGLEGYGLCRTWAHDGSGALVDEWSSFGRWLIDPGADVRVLECDRRMPTSSRTARLRRGGVVERGPALRDGCTGQPAVTPDGTAFFVDAGVLRSLDRDLALVDHATLFQVGERDVWRFHSRTELVAGELHVGVCERAPDSQDYVTHRFRFALAPK